MNDNELEAIRDEHLQSLDDVARETLRSMTMHGPMPSRLAIAVGAFIRQSGLSGVDVDEALSHAVRYARHVRPPTHEEAAERGPLN